MAEPTNQATLDGVSLAESHVRALSGIAYGSLFQDKARPFLGMGAKSNVEAMRAYSAHLMDLGEATKQPYYVEEYARDLVVAQLGKTMAGENLARIVQANEVRRLLDPCVRAWNKGQVDHPSRIERCRRLDRIFQSTQENYATGTGQRAALFGFRMLGQSIDDLGDSPFFCVQPSNKDRAIIRLSFFLRSRSNRSRIINMLETGVVGRDLARAWRGLHMDLQKTAQEMTPEEVRSRYIASMTVAGWLAQNHPNPLIKEISMGVRNNLEREISLEGETPLARTGMAFIQMAALQSMSGSRQIDKSTQKRKL